MNEATGNWWDSLETATASQAPAEEVAVQAPVNPNPNWWDSIGTPAATPAASALPDPVTPGEIAAPVEPTPPEIATSGSWWDSIPGTVPDKAPFEEPSPSVRLPTAEIASSPAADSAEGGEGSLVPTKAEAPEEEYISFADRVAGKSAGSAVPVNDGSRAFTLEEAKKQADAEGPISVPEQLSRLKPSEENVFYKTLGIAAGAVAADAAWMGVIGGTIGTVGGGIAAGGVAAVAWPVVLAAAAALAAGAAVSWAGKKIAESFSTEDEEKGALLTAQLRQTTGKYTDEELTAGVREKDKKLITVAQNEALVSALRPRGWWSTAAETGVDMLPLGAQFASIAGASNRIGSFLINPRKAARVYDAAAALVDASKAGVGPSLSFNGAVTQIMGGIAKAADKGKIPVSQIDDYARAIAERSKGAITKEAAFDYLRNYKKPGLLESHLTELLGAAVQTTVEDATFNRQEFDFEVAKRQMAGESNATTKAFLTGVVNNWSERMGGLLFDPVLGKVFGGAAVKYGAKVPRAIAEIGDGFKFIAQKLRLDSPIGEYWEESIGGLVSSALNLNDDGKTSQQTRIFESLTSFVPHTEEQAKMLFAFGVTGIFGATTAAAFGAETDMEKAARENSLSIIAPHLESAYSGPAAVVAVDQKQERTLARAFVDALVKSKDEDKSNFIVQKLADLFKLDDQFRYKKGSIAQVYEGIRGSSKDTTIESVKAMVEELRKENSKNGEEAAMDWVVKNITGRTTNAILAARGLAPLTFNLDEESAKQLNDLVKQGEITPKHSSDASLRGLVATPTGAKLDEKQQALIAAHANVVDAKGATGAESAANINRAIDESVLMKTAGNVPRKAKKTQMLQHMTRSGNYTHPGVKATEATADSVIELIERFGKVRNPKAGTQVKGFDVRLASQIISQNIRGHEELGRGAIYATNYIDPKTGRAQLVIGAEAETPDVVEDVGELSMKEKGTDAKKVRTVLQSIQRDYGERTLKKLEKLTANRQLSEEDLKNVKAIKAMIQHIGNVRERSAPDYDPDAKDSKGPKLNDQQVVEFASSFTTALLSMNNIGTNSEADLLKGKYFSKQNQARVFADAFHAMRQLSDIGPEMMVSAADAVNQLIDINQFDKNSRSSYQRFADAASPGMNRSAQRRSAESQQRRKDEKPVEKKPKVKVTTPPPEKPVEKPAESKPAEPKPAEPKPVVLTPEEEANAIIDELFSEMGHSAGALPKPDGKMSKEEAAYRTRVAGVNLGRVVLEKIVSGKFRISYILKNADLMFSVSNKNTVDNIRRFANVPPELVLDDDTLERALDATRAALGLSEKGEVSFKRKFRLLQKRVILYKTVPFELNDALSDAGIYETIADQFRAASEALDGVVAALEDPEFEGEIEKQVGQEAIDEESTRAAMGVNDAVKALGFSSEFDRVKLWEMLSPFSTHPEAEKFRAAAIAAMMGTKEEYEQFLALGYPEDAFIDEFLNRVNLHNMGQPNQQGFRHLLVTMNSTYIPLVGHGIFQESKDGMKSEAIRIADMKSRIAGSLVRTFNERFSMIAESPNLLLDTFYYYIQAFNEAEFARPTEEKPYPLDAITVADFGKFNGVGRFNQIYRFMETLLGVDAKELFNVDVEYKKANPDLLPPTLASFYIELKPVIQAKTAGGAKLVEWDSGARDRKTGEKVPADQQVQTFSFNPQLTKHEVLVKGTSGAALLDQYTWAEGAEKQYGQFRREVLQQFHDSIKAGGRASSAYKAPRKDEKKSRDTSNLHEIAQGLAKSGRHISIKKAQGGVVFNAMSTSHLTAVASKLGWELGRLMTISRSEDGTISANFGTSEEAVDVEDFNWADVERIMYGEFDKTPVGENYRAWLSPFSEKKDIYTLPREKQTEAAVREEYTRRLAALFFGKTAESVTAADLKNFEDPKDYDALPDKHSWKQFLAHPKYITTSFGLHHALTTLDTIIAIHSDKLTEDYKNSEEMVKRRGSDVASGYSMIKEEYVAKTGRDYIAAAVINDPKLRALVSKLLGREGKEVEAADGLAVSVNNSMDLAAELYGSGITKVGEKGQPTRLNMMKAIVAGPREIFKQSLHRLPSFFTPEDRGMLYQLSQLVERHNKLGEPLDMIVFSSAAKKKGQKKTSQDIFDTSNPDEVKLLPDVASNKAFTFENITRFPVEQFKWQLNLQKPPKLKNSVVPRQPIAVAAQNHNTRDKYFSAVMQQIMGTDELLALGYNPGDNPKEFKGFPLDKLVPASGHPMRGVMAKVFGPDAFSLMDYTEQLAKAVRKLLQFRTPLTQAVEVPLGQSTDDVRDYVGRKKNGVGEWVDTPNLKEAGVRMAYAHVQVNVEAQKKDGLRYNERAEGIASNWTPAKAIQAMSQFVRDNWETYLDMFERPELVKTAEDAAKQPVREWEFFRNKAGQWMIPGEPMLIARIPADNMYSTSVVRAGERYIVKEGETDAYELPNLIRTPLSLQVVAGSDFDADKRFILPFVGRGAKRASLDSGWNSVLASMMQDFDSPSNYELFMEPLDTELFDNTVTEVSPETAEALWRASSQLEGVPKTRASSAIPGGVSSFKTKVEGAEAKVSRNESGAWELTQFGAIDKVREQAASLLAINLTELEALKKSDPNRYHLAKAVQESLGGSALQIGTVEGALALYRSNQVGKRGLGQAAALLYGFNLMESVGIRLQQTAEATAFKGFTFTNPFNGKPAEIIAGRTGGEGLGNYVTTTKRLFGTFLNLFADHGKLQKITKLGIDDSNIHIVMALMFAHGDFKDLDAELDYLVNTVVPFLYTAESLEVQRDNQRLNSVYLTASVKADIWEKESKMDAEGRPVSRFEQVEIMARSFQKLNQILRSGFRDTTLNVSEHEKLQEAVNTFQGMNRKEGNPGQYGAWDLGEIPDIFNPALRGLGILNDRAYRGTLRASPAWEAVKAKLFTAPVADKPETKTEPLVQVSDSNLETLYAEMHNAVALLSVTDHLSKLAGLKAGEDASLALRALAQKTVDELVAKDSAFADNRLFSFVTSGIAEQYVLQTQPRTATGAKSPNKQVERTSPIMQIGVAPVFRSSPISDAEIERVRPDFNKLPEQAKAVLTLYAVYRYGVTEPRSFRGSYLQFISDEYRLAIHEATADKFKALLTQPWTDQQVTWFTDYVQEKLRRTPKDSGAKEPMRANLLLPVPSGGIERVTAAAVEAPPAVEALPAVETPPAPPAVEAPPAPPETVEAMVKRMVAEQLAAALKEKGISETPPAVTPPAVEAPPVVTPPAAEPIVQTTETGVIIRNEDGSPLHTNGGFSVTQIVHDWGHSSRLNITSLDNEAIEIFISDDGKIRTTVNGAGIPPFDHSKLFPKWLGQEVANNIFKFANAVAAGTLSKEQLIEQSKNLLIPPKAVPRVLSPDAKTPTEAIKELPPPKMSDTVKLDLGNGVQAPATQDQANAMEALVNFFKSKEPVFVLEGYAGTGKTALVKTLLNSAFVKSKQAMFGAPSHQARIVLSRAVGRRASGSSYTVASLTGKMVDDSSGNFKKGEANEKRWKWADIVVIDEASMIPESDLDILLKYATKYDTKIIFMGDPGQALPIRSELADKQFQGKPAPAFTRFTGSKATLHAVMRQKSDSPLSALVSVLRGLVDLPDHMRRKVTELNARGEGAVYHRDSTTFLSDLLRVARELKAKDPKLLAGVKVISWTNTARAKWAVAIRQQLFPDAVDGYAPGMVVTGYKNYKENYDSPVHQVYNSANYLIKSISDVTRNSDGYQGRWFELDPIDTADDSTQDKRVRLFVITSAEHDRMAIEANAKLEAAIKHQLPWAAYYAFIRHNLSTRPILKTASANQTIAHERSQKIADLEKSIAYANDNPGVSEKTRSGLEVALEELKFEETKAAKDKSVVTDGKPIFDNGMAITTHKAQGSTYEYAFVDEDNLDSNSDKNEVKHLKYTAVSRASKAAHLLSRDSESEGMPAAAPAAPKVEAPAAPSMDPLRRKAIEKEIEDLRVQWKNTPSIEGKKAVQKLAETLKKQLTDAEAPAVQHSARHIPSSRTPVSIKQAISWAAKEKSLITPGLHIKSAQGKLDKLRELVDAIEADDSLDIKGREDAIVKAASPYYREFPALRLFVYRLFRDAPNREERYLENRLSGNEPGYIGNPEHRKPYQTEMFESLNPKAASEVKALLNDTPAPNMQDSHIKLSHSARYSAAAEAIFNDLPDVYGNKNAQEILKLATRSGRWGVTNSAIASQKLRRKVGARQLGYADTGKKKNQLGNRVLEALTVLVEHHGELFAAWNPIAKTDAERKANAQIEAKLLELAEKNDLRILRSAVSDLIENPDTSDEASAYIAAETAEKVADVLREYMATSQYKKHSFIEVGRDVVDTMENLRNFANASVGYDWIAPFKYGQHNYVIHQYVYPESSSPTDRERWQSEETARVIERDDEHKTYTMAALNFGHMPKTLNAAELIEGWGTSVNQIMQNKIMLTGLSRIKDRYGNSMIVPARVLGAQEGNVRGSVIPEKDAEDTLKSLIQAAEAYSAAHRKQFTWNIDPTDSVWDSLNKLTQDLAGNQDKYDTSLLNALGYAKVTVKRTFGLQNQDFYVVKGAPLQAVRHLVEENFEELASDGDKYRYKLLNGILKINRMIKSVNVSFSLFQHFALIESWLADAGPFGVIQLMKNILTARKTYTEMMENGDTASQWIRHGLQLSVIPYDTDLNIMDRGIAGMAKSFDKVGLTFVGNRVRTLLNLKKGADNFLWHVLTPLMKIQVAEAAFKGVAKRHPDVVDIPEKDMTPEQRKATYEARDDIAKYVNDSLGSQEWAQFMWATPHVRDLMNTFMFSPDWTLSALNISGVPETIGKVMDRKWLGYESFTDFGMKHRLTHYIPGFFTWVFIAWPALIQASIAMAFGGGDGDDDNLFPLMNEEGQKFSADISPLIRHYQRKRGVPEELLSREKTYLQPGKQVREVFQWFTDPVRTGFSKAAPPIRMAISGITGVVSPSISVDKTWASKNEADKWSKIMGSVFPFSVTALTRPDNLGGPVGALLTSTLPRNSGKTRFALQGELTGDYRDFLKGKGVRTQSPEQAFEILQSRIAERKENFLGKSGSGNQVLWDKANEGALESMRTSLNRQLKDEYSKPDAKRDSEKIQRLLYAVLLTHKSTKETYQSLESSFKSALTTQDSVRNPEKVERLTGREGLRQMRQDLYEVSGKNNVRPFKLK